MIVTRISLGRGGKLIQHNYPSCRTESTSTDEIETHLHDPLRYHDQYWLNTIYKQPIPVILALKPINVTCQHPGQNTSQ